MSKPIEKKILEWTEEVMEMLLDGDKKSAIEKLKDEYADLMARMAFIRKTLKKIDKESGNIQGSEELKGAVDGVNGSC